MKNQLFALGMIARSVIKLPLGIFALLSFFIVYNISFVLVFIGIKSKPEDIVLTKKDFMFACTKPFSNMEKFFAIDKAEQDMEFIRESNNNS